jgi:hypothetical protein
MGKSATKSPMPNKESWRPSQCTEGNEDCCGKIKYEVVDPTFRGFFDFDEEKDKIDGVKNLITSISVKTKSEDHIGEHLVVVRTYLKDYPSVQTFTTFNVSITSCFVASIMWEPITTAIFEAKIE